MEIGFYKIIQITVQNKFSVFGQKNSNNVNKQLLIISDSCFSGVWCEYLKKKSSELKNFPIAVQSACSESEFAYEGQLTSLLFNQNSTVYQNPKYFFTNCYKRIGFEKDFQGTTTKVDIVARGGFSHSNSNARKIWKNGIIAAWDKSVVALKDCATAGSWFKMDNSRIDLQSPAFALYVNPNNGDVQSQKDKSTLTKYFGNFQLQNQNGSYACVVIECDQNFGIQTIKTAFEDSLDQGKTIWLYYGMKTLQTHSEPSEKRPESMRYSENKN